MSHNALFPILESRNLLLIIPHYSSIATEVNRVSSSGVNLPPAFPHKHSSFPPNTPASPQTLQLPPLFEATLSAVLTDREKANSRGWRDCLQEPWDHLPCRGQHFLHVCSWLCLARKSWFFCKVQRSSAFVTTLYRRVRVLSWLFERTWTHTGRISIIHI